MPPCPCEYQFQLAQIKIPDFYAHLRARLCRWRFSCRSALELDNEERKLWGTCTPREELGALVTGKWTALVNPIDCRGCDVSGFIHFVRVLWGMS